MGGWCRQRPLMASLRPPIACRNVRLICINFGMNESREIKVETDPSETMRLRVYPRKLFPPKIRFLTCQVRESISLPAHQIRPIHLRTFQKKISRLASNSSHFSTGEFVSLKFFKIKWPPIEWTRREVLFWKFVLGCGVR